MARGIVALSIRRLPGSLFKLRARAARPFTTLSSGLATSVRRWVSTKTSVCHSRMSCSCLQITAVNATRARPTLPASKPVRRRRRLRALRLAWIRRRSGESAAVSSRQRSASCRGLPPSTVPLRSYSARAPCTRPRQSRKSRLACSQWFSTGQVRSSASWATSIVPVCLPEISRRASTKRRSVARLASGIASQRATTRPSCPSSLMRHICRKAWRRASCSSGLRGQAASRPSAARCTDPAKPPRRSYASKVRSPLPLWRSHNSRREKASRGRASPVLVSATIRSTNAGSNPTPATSAGPAITWA